MRMPTPLVSVKMITYNHAPYIAQAIECVLAQKTDFPFELVIGEDCSTDGTREIVFDYAKRYPDIIHVITSEKNVGAKKNSHRTDQACKGKYIAYCEGDDYWQRDDKLQIQADYLEAHPECGLVCSDYDYFDTKNLVKINNYRLYSKKTIESPSINDILAGNADILTVTVVAENSLIQQVKKSDPYLHQNSYFKMGDTQLWAEMSLITQIHCINESLATHQILKESATQSTDRLKILRFWISNTEMCLYLCQKHNLPTSIKEWHENNWRRKSLQLGFYEQRVDLAETVREKFPHLSPKDWLWYLGTKYSVIRACILTIKMLHGRAK
jgi:glycosyltransferase involved in cell wall biosynthesis